MNNMQNIGVECLILNKPNLNGRTYTTEVIEEALKNKQKDIENKRLFLTRHVSLGPELSVDLNDVVGVVEKCYIEGDELLADISILALASDVAYFNLEGKLSVRPNGIGNVDEYGTVRNYSLISFILTDDPA